MLVVALTGGIGAGKSLVAQYFSELGARVVDADQLNVALRDLMKSSPDLAKAFCATAI